MVGSEPCLTPGPGSVPYQMAVPRRRRQRAPMTTMEGPGPSTRPRRLFRMQLPEQAVSSFGCGGRADLWTSSQRRRFLRLLARDPRMNGRANNLSRLTGSQSTSEVPEKAVDVSCTFLVVAEVLPKSGSIICTGRGDFVGRSGCPNGRSRCSCSRFSLV